MSEKKTHWSVYATLTLLLVSCLALIVTQVLTANTATKLESTLFNIIQFSLSIAFSWILSKLITEQQFLESQKKFAIGAFRRIMEIERSLSRTQKYVTNAKLSKPSDFSAKLEAIDISIVNAQDTVKSSIADWTDIIGDEIEVTNEVRRLKKTRNYQTEIDSEINLPINDSSENIREEKIEKLQNSLPAEIRVSLAEEDKNPFEAGYEYLADICEEKKTLELTGFWDKSDSFTASPADLKRGDTVTVARGMTTSRNGVLLAYNDQDKWFGVITNPCADINVDYDSFVSVFEMFYEKEFLPKVFGGTPLKATVLEIFELDLELDRQYFRLEVNTPEQL
jgi:hypothetical protein